MPPQRTIIVDSKRMLQSIADLSDEQVEDTRERTRTWGDRQAAALAEAQWVRRRVGTFARTVLTPSQAKRWQQRLVEMGTEGLVELTPSHVRLTDAGRASLDETN